MNDELKLRFLKELSKGNVRIGQLVIEVHGDNHYHEKYIENTLNQYSDAQVCTALSNIVGKGKAIDSKQKWAGALWLLHWRCGYPIKAQDFCERIERLQLPQDLEYKCDYRNIRELATLSFIGEDATHMDQVRYSKNDEAAFLQLRGVAIALDKELSLSRDISL